MSNQRQKLKVFMDFQTAEGGIYPVSAAAVRLKMSAQGVHSAIERRKISSIKWAGLTYCGFRSVENYRWLFSTKFSDNKHKKLSQLHVQMREKGNHDA